MESKAPAEFGTGATRSKEEVGQRIDSFALSGLPGFLQIAGGRSILSRLTQQGRKVRGTSILSSASKGSTATALRDVRS